MMTRQFCGRVPSLPGAARPEAARCDMPQPVALLSH